MSLISICVATYQRPEGLRALLESIEQQSLPNDVAVEIIVVDNDPPSAKPVVCAHAHTSQYDVRYLSQSEQNISLTRNVAVEASTGDFVWFVDDDEVADPACLGRLLSAIEEHDAAGVFGPVLASFDGDAVPDWSKQFYQRPVHTTGSISTAHRTSNTLVRSEVLARVPGPFDPEYGVTGGTDSMLFRQLESEGFQFINSAAAFVTEAVPANRASWEWLTTRARRQGQNYGRQTVTLHGKPLTPGVMFMSLKAVIQITTSGALAIATWTDRSRRASHLLHMWTNVGKLEGVAGSSTTRDT